MAIFHCQIKPMSRSDGYNAVASAAYRSGSHLNDQSGLMYDYTKKQGIIAKTLVFPSGINFSRSELWNMAEQAETRGNARVAREFEIALPVELNFEQQNAVAIKFAKKLVNDYGIAADVCIHKPNKKNKEENPHAHIMITTRTISQSGLGKKSQLEWADRDLRKAKLPIAKETVKELRFQWQEICNTALKEAGSEARIDCRSLEDQGIDREAQIHLGVAVLAMERRGIKTDRGKIYKEIKKENENGTTGSKHNSIERMDAENGQMGERNRHKNNIAERGDNEIKTGHRNISGRNQPSPTRNAEPRETQNQRSGGSNPDTDQGNLGKHERLARMDRRNRKDEQIKNARIIKLAKKILDMLWIKKNNNEILKMAELPDNIKINQTTQDILKCLREKQDNADLQEIAQTLQTKKEVEETNFHLKQ